MPLGASFPVGSTFLRAEFISDRGGFISDIITGPSGLSGCIQGMKAREEKILADRKAARGGMQLEQILAAYWEETLDAGPYDFGDRVIDRAKALQGTVSSPRSRSAP